MAKKFGIYGGSMIARFHAQAIKATDKGELIAVFARRQDRAEELANEFGCKAFWDENAFFNHDELDVITIATPSGAHLEPAMKAAAAKKHVICEKPLEITTSRIDQMIQAANENGVVLAGIFNRRFNPAFEALQKAVDQERFGNLALAQASIKWYRDQAYYESSNWKGTWEWDGGGALMNQSIHTIDQLVKLAGPVQSVQASTTRRAHPSIEVEDTAVALLEFANGALGMIEGSTACWSKSGNPAEIHLSGSKGTAIMQDDRFRVWEFEEEKPEDDEILSSLMVSSEAKGLGANDPTAINADGHRRNFEDFIEAIEANRAPLIDGVEARKPVDVICSIYDSAKQDGKKIVID